MIGRDDASSQIKCVKFRWWCLLEVDSIRSEDSSSHSASNSDGGGCLFEVDSIRR